MKEKKPACGVRSHYNHDNDIPVYRILEGRIKLDLN